MNPGLPGLGIGGLFYLISALAMPLVALVRQIRGEPARWGLACRQALMAAGIFGSMALVFALLDLLLGPNAAPLGAAGSMLAAVGDKRVSIMMLTLAVLVIVLTLMHGVRLTLQLRASAVRRQIEVDAQSYRSTARPATIGLE